MNQDDTQTLAKSIAERLGETEPGSVDQIARALQVCGVERVQSVVTDTLQVEADGGMMLPDGNRRRTPGGVFFVLLRQRASKEEWHRIRYQSESKPARPVTPPLAWAERAEAVNEAATAAGMAWSATIKIMGRPKEVKPQDDFVVVTMESRGDLPAVSYELPRPSSMATTYRVCIGLSQWLKIEEALADSQNALIVTGYALPNTKQRTVVVFADHAAVHAADRASPDEGWGAAVQIKITTRPGKVVQRGATAVMTVVSGKAPRMPDDLPELPRRSVPYTVYMTDKNWRKVAPALDDPAVSLFVEGWVFYDAELNGIAVLAQNVLPRHRSTSG